MSGRYRDFDKGSSRSTRDDSRPYKERREGRERRRSRSRSPRRWSPSRRDDYEPDRSSHSRERDSRSYDDTSDRHVLDWDESEDVPAPPPPPRITKISIGFNKPKGPIKMNIGGPAKPVAKPTVASVFNDDDDEPEEMPAEARMRMRNIGRETPTSAGPNSFGKTKQGFCDAKKVFEKNLKQALEQADNKPALPKLPQTIYKIKGP
ncbi:unnamed protein product [Chrysodeixis includens]|uniref:PEST proteolytic signal-containing nuclear protein n=1 Tax=Chrysodeixis includens TaxID=689277 RepID=A0A9P0BQP8_CHRIL|nr:unnamed protein product [Chrysodeixis includens]